MADTATTQPARGWTGILAWLATFAESVEMDGFTHHDLRIDALERRLAALECQLAAPPRP